MENRRSGGKKLRTKITQSKACASGPTASTEDNLRDVKKCHKRKNEIHPSVVTPKQAKKITQPIACGSHDIRLLAHLGAIYNLPPGHPMAAEKLAKAQELLISLIKFPTLEENFEEDLASINEFIASHGREIAYARQRIEELERDLPKLRKDPSWKGTGELILMEQILIDHKVHSEQFNVLLLDSLIRRETIREHYARAIEERNKNRVE